MRRWLGKLADVVAVCMIMNGGRFGRDSCLGFAWLAWLGRGLYLERSGNGVVGYLEMDVRAGCRSDF